MLCNLLHPCSMALHLNIDVAMQICAAAQPASTPASALPARAQLPGLESAAIQGVSQSHFPLWILHPHHALAVAQHLHTCFECVLRLYQIHFLPL